MKSRTLRRVQSALAAVGALLAVSFLVAPSVSARAATTSGSTTWHVHVGEQSPNGAIQGMRFLPGDIWVDVGDTVQWTSASMEPHTVTFLPVGQLPGPFNPTDPAQTTQTTDDTISAPGAFRNSGVMSTIQFSELPSPTITSYELTFDGPGDYVYYCLVHGQAMKGTVHVAAAGTAYPHTQAFYDTQFNVGRGHVIGAGYRLYGQAMSASTNQHVYVGAIDEMGMAMVMRFMRSTVTVHVGQTIDFDASLDHGDPVPHTVTFGPEPPAPFPVGDPTNFTGGTLSSGVIPTAGPGAHYRVTFNKAGTFPYICMFHDGMGMTGTVIVTR